MNETISRRDRVNEITKNVAKDLLADVQQLFEARQHAAIFRPYNPVTGHFYTGSNRINLIVYNMVKMSKGLKVDPRFFPSDQMQTFGERINRIGDKSKALRIVGGEKAIYILRPKSFSREVNKEVSNEDEMTLADLASGVEPTIEMVKTRETAGVVIVPYPVFNALQMVGVPPYIDKHGEIVALDDALKMAGTSSVFEWLHREKIIPVTAKEDDSLQWTLTEVMVRAAFGAEPTKKAVENLKEVSEALAKATNNELARAIVDAGSIAMERMEGALNYVRVKTVLNSKTETRSEAAAEPNLLVTFTGTAEKETIKAAIAAAQAVFVASGVRVRDAYKADYQSAIGGSADPTALLAWDRAREAAKGVVRTSSTQVLMATVSLEFVGAEVAAVQREVDEEESASREEPDMQHRAPPSLSGADLQTFFC